MRSEKRLVCGIAGAYLILDIIIVWVKKDSQALPWYEKYPDIYFVTDTKYSSKVPEDFQLFVDTAIENGYEDVLSRVDEEEEGRQRIQQGVSGIYSDDILPDTVRQWLEDLSPIAQ